MLNMFLDTMMADPPPQCLVWLPLMHRLAHVENGEHGLTLCPLGFREEEAVCGIQSYYCEKLKLTFVGTSFELVAFVSEEEYFIAKAGVLSLT